MHYVANIKTRAPWYSPPRRKLFYCFKCKKGGDYASLVASAKGIAIRDAFIELAKACGVQSTAPPAPKAFDAEKYLTTLDPEHESLKAIGLTAQTLREWKAGYKKGKLMAAIEGSEGIAGFMAISLEDQTTTFPKDVDPRLYIFGGYRLQMGDVQLLRSPLDVLMASEHGITNCIAFLTEKISVGQLFYLSKLLEDRKLESIILM